MKLIYELGGLALGTRFALLAEQLYDEVQAIYRASDIDFDPRNFLLFRALMQPDDASVCALAREIRCTHARASQKLGELEEQKLVERIESSDGRKSCFRLSAKGRQLIARLEPVWNTLEATLRDEFATDTVLAELSRFEDRMTPGRLSSLVLARLAESGTDPERAPRNLTFKVLEPPFTRQVTADFERLNHAWLKEHGFSIEAPDRALFSDLSGYLREHGGLLLIGESNNGIAATALLLPHGAKEFEIAKFCVDKAARGRGIGRRLLAMCETEARVRGAVILYLETSTKLKAAARLYEAAGFCSKPAINSPYTRVDLIMTKSV